MLRWVCSVIHVDHRRRQNVVRTSVTHSAIASCATFLFLPHFDVICDLLLNRRTATWNLFVKHQTHYEKSDWSRAFNQFTIACELDMINVISAADITFIMSSSTSAWLLSPLECSPQKQNG